MSVFHQFESSFHSLLCDALDYTHECMVLTDCDGNIIYMNKPYQEFLHVTDDVIGCHVTEVIENTRMHVVARTGRAEIAQIQRIRGRDMIANRIPILRNGEVIAVIGTVMFQDVQELYALTATVERLHKQDNLHKGEELKLKSSRSLTITTRIDEIIGNTEPMIELKRLALRVSKTDTTVLITGESGTGKELLARVIHTSSQRRMGPFITVNCAAIPETLLESELFGYERGAFTGASPSGKKGKFELAHRGTILLDEVGDMPSHLQAKLLRVLQEREIERIGGHQPIPVDVRIISSTHQNLANQIQSGNFREDLFYRLNVMNLHIPPLRWRLEDIEPLTKEILKQLEATIGVEVTSIDDTVWLKLRQHSWPGNIRELRNVLERSVHLMEGTILNLQHITFPLASLTLSPGTAHGSQSTTLKDTLCMAEKQAILEALSAAHGNRREAAKLLGISKSALYQKLSDYRI